MCTMRVFHVPSSAAVGLGAQRGTFAAMCEVRKVAPAACSEALCDRDGVEGWREVQSVVRWTLTKGSRPRSCPGRFPTPVFVASASVWLDAGSVMCRCYTHPRMACFSRNHRGP